MPAALEEGLEPSGEVDRLVRRLRSGISQITHAKPGGEVERSAKLRSLGELKPQKGAAEHAGHPRPQCDCLNARDAH